MRNKRATDKPIEIFIALFVILAVAMVILKMFSSQIEQKKTEMEEQQQEERARQAMADLDTYCDSQCAKAHRSLKDKISYCSSYYRGEIDINKNSMPDFTMAIDNIQGFCEDRIYCAAYRPCGSLDIKNCKQLVCEYFRNNLQISSDQDKAERLVGPFIDTGRYDGLFSPGECWYRLTPEQKKYHWFTTFLSVDDINDVDANGNHMGGQCFLEEGSCYDRYNDILEEFGSVYPGNTWDDACPVY